MVVWDGVDVGEAAAGGVVDGVVTACGIVDCGFRLVHGLAGVDFGGADGGYVGAVDRPCWVLGCWSVRRTCVGETRCLVVSRQGLGIQASMIW